MALDIFYYTANWLAVHVSALKNARAELAVKRQFAILVSAAPTYNLVTTNHLLAYISALLRCQPQP
jgi:hypothetical protein